MAIKAIFANADTPSQDKARDEETLAFWDAETRESYERSEGGDTVYHAAPGNGLQ